MCVHSSAIPKSPKVRKSLSRLFRHLGELALLLTHISPFWRTYESNDSHILEYVGESYRFRQRFRLEEQRGMESKTETG